MRERVRTARITLYSVWLFGRAAAARKMAKNKPFPVFKQPGPLRLFAYLL